MEIPEPLPWEQRVNGASPLPGGYSGYLGSFRTICERVEQGSASFEELVAWARERFNISETNARHSLAFLRNAGLMRQSDGIVSLDERVRHWMQNGGDDIPIAMIHSRFKFVGEMLSELEEPKSAEALRKAAARYGLDWQTYAQIQIRRGWLQSANLIEGATNRLKLTDAGRHLLSQLKNHVPSENMEVTRTSNGQKRPEQLKPSARKPVGTTDADRLAEELLVASTTSADPGRFDKKKGEASAFVKVSPQTFALRNSSAKSNVALAVPAAVEETAKPSRANAGFSFTDCAQKVLEEFGGKKPMHYKEITETALQKGWLVTVGKTPEATMYAQVITEIKRQQKRGERPRFVQHGRGYVGLSQWMGRGLAFQIEQHNNQVRKALRERLLEMKPGEFEELISLLLAEMGFEKVEVTKLSGDGGIDVRGTLVVGGVVRIKMAVQVKKWKLKNNILAPVVQQVRGSLGAHEQGLIITTSNFSAGAIKEASQPDKTPIALMNGEQLVMLMMEHGIGVHRSTPNLFEIAEEELVIGEGK